MTPTGPGSWCPTGTPISLGCGYGVYGTSVRVVTAGSEPGGQSGAQPVGRIHVAAEHHDRDVAGRPAPGGGGPRRGAGGPRPAGVGGGNTHAPPAAPRPPTG